MGSGICSCLDNIAGNESENLSRNANNDLSKPTKIESNPKTNFNEIDKLNASINDFHSRNINNNTKTPPTSAQSNQIKTRTNKINTYSIDINSINSDSIYNGRRTTDINISSNENRSITNSNNDVNTSNINTKRSEKNKTIEKKSSKLQKKLPKEGLITYNFIHFFESPKGQEMAVNINNFPNKLCISIHKYLLRLLAKKEYNKHIKEYISNSQKLCKTCIEKIYKNNPKLKDFESSSKIIYSKDGYKKYYTDEKDINNMTITEKDTTLYDNCIIINYKNDDSSSLDNILWIYKGQVNENNEPYGFGEFFSINGILKKGYFKNGELQGWGQIIIPNNYIMIGYFNEDVLSGKGEKYTEKLRSVYIGDFLDNKKHGKGEEKSKEGKYIGSFKNDKKHGEGKMIYNISGDIYEGEYKNDLFDGKGHYIYKSSGQEYKGEYKEGKMHGKGLYEWSESEYYRGEFNEGKKEGQGEIHWANGRSFIGPFLNGRPNGVGIFDNGINFKGEMEFIDGKMNVKYFNKQNSSTDRSNVNSGVQSFRDTK